MSLSRGLRVAIAAACVVLGMHGAAAAKYASYVVDADSGQVLHSINADERKYPASLTKMMTLYLTFEALDKGRLKMSTPLSVSAHAERQPASRLGVRRGESLTVHQAILALVTRSANDVAVVVGESLGGTEAAFARKMTEKARQLGMMHTTFRNASGLHNRGQMTTARDMALLAKALMRDFPQYYPMFGTHQFTYDGQVFKNHNALLDSYEGTDGIKTGYVAASGFNLVASARRNGHRLIGVVLGGRSPSSRNSHMIALLDKSFENLQASAPGAKPTPFVSAWADSSAAAADESEGDADTEQVAAAAAGSWGIQVGAFTAYDPAYNAAVKAMAKTPRLLDDGSVAVAPYKSKKRTLYRARVVGIGKDEAYQACKALKRKGGDCMVLRVKPEA